MGIFKRGKHQPGTESSQPEGDGPVTLEDRVEGGSPDTNQGKVEPMSPTPDHPEPLAAPELADMNVGAADPQSPSLASAAAPPPAAQVVPPTGLSGPGAELEAERPQVDTATSTGRSGGPAAPVQHGSGQSHRVTGLQGTTPRGEAVDSDVQAGAASMSEAGPDVQGQGDAASAPAAGDGAAPGTSETQEPVQGVRLPDASEA
jgi:hypothetical protein